MSNLSVEGLNKIIQTGDVEKLFGHAGGITSSESKVTQEMQNQGMAPSAPHEVGKNFSDILRDSVDKVNLDQVQANTSIKELVAGRNKNIHETMLTVEKADSSLKMMMQVRNKILEAYKEIMRMQV